MPNLQDSITIIDLNLIDQSYLFVKINLNQDFKQKVITNQTKYLDFDQKYSKSINLNFKMLTKELFIPIPKTTDSSFG